MTNSFARFRELNKKRIAAQQVLNNSFVFNGYNSIDITSGSTTVKAAVVNQQEKDKAYIYTAKETELSIGSVWGAKGLHWLISEEIITIKDVEWNKYSAYLCNFAVENVWGMFKGPEKTYVNVSLEKENIIMSEQKPVIILPKDVLGFKDKIVINGRAWLVQEYDAISSPGIVYYSLTPTTVSKDVSTADVYIERANTYESEIIVEPTKPTTTSTYYEIGHNINITLSTVDGYFTFTNKNIKVVKRSETEIIFNLPFGVEEVTVGYKNSNSVVETITYKAVD